MSRDSIRRASAVRILLDYRPALRARTGVGQYVHEAACALVATAPSGEALTLFSSSWKDRLVPHAVPGAYAIDQRVPVRVLNFLWHRLEWPSVEFMAGADFDIVQTAHPLLAPAKRAARLVTIHDLDFLEHPERTRAEIRRDYPELAARHAARADQIVVVSEHTAHQVQSKLGVSRDRISICSPGAPDWPRREAEPAEGGCILFLGTLEARKNVGALLDAYERLLTMRPETPRLVLAGGHPPEAAPLLERARRAPLAGHVEIAGYVPPDERVALFNRALVLVLPSHLEGFGMPAAEAMTIGVPVVVANRGALPEVVGDAGRLVDPADDLALTNALAEVLSAPVLRREMTERGWRQARRYSWAGTAERLREAWQAALAHREERRRG
jgi:glycosyltransferase involved in cell wall biosynthesis